MGYSVSTMKAITITVSHVRRCHVCGTVNETEGASIHKCAHCGKHLAPFYYFDESQLEGISAEGEFLSTIKHSKEYFPLWGLSTYWSDDIESKY